MIKLYEGNEEYSIHFDSGKVVTLSQNELEELEIYCENLENELDCEKTARQILEKKIADLEYLYQKVVENNSIQCE